MTEALPVTVANGGPVWAAWQEESVRSGFNSQLLPVAQGDTGQEAGSSALGVTGANGMALPCGVGVGWSCVLRSRVPRPGSGLAPSRPQIRRVLVFSVSCLDCEE